VADAVAAVLTTPNIHAGTVYIEVMTDAYEAPPMYKKLHENIVSPTDI